MIYRLLANGVVIVHLAFVVFVIFGGLLTLKWPRVALLHLPSAAWGAVIEFAGWICPLTPLENWLRRRGGEQAFAGSFIDHYIVPLLYPEGLTTSHQWLLGTAVIAINTIVYIAAYRRHTL